MYNLIIFDGNHLAHRCYHRFKDFNNSVDFKIYNKWKFTEPLKGKECLISTGLVYGFLQNIISVKMKYGDKNTKIIICWDSKCKWRKDLYPEYKAGRPREEIEYQHSFYFQYLILREILKSANATECQVYDYEADDLLYTLALKYYKKKKILLVSGDKDLFQTLEYCDILRNVKNFQIIYTQQDFIDEFGIYPKMFTKVKAMAGDTSDNIKGWKGVGIITALKILKGCGKFFKLENLPEKYNTKEHIEMFKRNIKLVTSKYCDQLRMPRHYVDKSNIKKLFYMMKFRHFLRKDNFKLFLNLIK